MKNLIYIQVKPRGSSRIYSYSMLAVPEAKVGEMVEVPMRGKPVKCVLEKIMATDDEINNFLATLSYDVNKIVQLTELKALVEEPEEASPAHLARFLKQNPDYTLTEPLTATSESDDSSISVTTTDFSRFLS